MGGVIIRVFVLSTKEKSSEGIGKKKKKFKHVHNVSRKWRLLHKRGDVGLCVRLRYIRNNEI